jgi:hypothetical protein
MRESKRRNPRKPPQETAPLEVQGAFLERVTQIPSGSASLVTTLGVADGKRFLVPFVDLSFTESISLEGDLVEEMEAFGRILTLENAAFLMTILASELSEVFSEYETIASDKAGAEPTRFNAIAGYLDEAEKGLAAIRQSLTRLTTTAAA